MLRVLRFPVFIYVLSILINIVFILYVFSSIGEEVINIYFNSDCLYLPSIYKDICVDHGTIQGWHLSPSPGFFPDMFFYFLLMGCFKNFVLVSLLYAIIQYSALLFLIFALFNTISENVSFIHLAIANLSMTMFFMAATLSKDFIFTFYLINNAFHFGSFIMCLACLILIFKFFKTNHYKYLIGLFLFGIIAVVSDRLFIVLYSFPILAMCLLMFNKQDKRQLLLVIGCNFFIVLIGLGLFFIIARSGIVFIGQPNRILEYKHILESFSILKEQFGIYLTEGSVKTIILWFSIVSFIVTIIIGVKKIILFKRTKNQQKISSNLLLCYSLFSVFFMIIVFFAPIVNGSYTGFDTIRYNIYVLYLAVFNIGILAMYYLKKTKTIERIVSVITIIFFIVLLFLFSKNDGIYGLNKFVNYYPKMVENVDSIANVHNLKYGVAGYWNAKFITMFSKKDLRVYAVYKEMTPYYHATNLNWFYDSEHGNYNRPVFNFVITDTIMDKSSFYKTFGDTCQEIKTNNITLNKVYNFRFEKKNYLPVRQ